MTTFNSNITMIFKLANPKTTQFFKNQFQFWDTYLVPLAFVQVILDLMLSSVSIWVIGVVLACGIMDTVVWQGLKRFILPHNANKHVEYMMIRGLTMGVMFSALSGFTGWGAVWYLCLSSLAFVPVSLVVVTVMSLFRSLCRKLFFSFRGWERDRLEARHGGGFRELHPHLYVDTTSTFSALKADLSDWGSVVGLVVCMTGIFSFPISPTVSLFYFLSQLVVCQALAVCFYTISDVICTILLFFLTGLIALSIGILNCTLFHENVPKVMTDLVLMACMLGGGYALCGVPVASVLFLMRNFIFPFIWSEIYQQRSHWARCRLVLHYMIRPIRSVVIPDILEGDRYGAHGASHEEHLSAADSRLSLVNKRDANDWAIPKIQQHITESMQSIRDSKAKKDREEYKKLESAESCIAYLLDFGTHKDILQLLDTAYTEMLKRKKENLWPWFYDMLHEIKHANGDNNISCKLGMKTRIAQFFRMLDSKHELAKVQPLKFADVRKKMDGIVVAWLCEKIPTIKDQGQRAVVQKFLKKENKSDEENPKDRSVEKFFELCQCLSKKKFKTDTKSSAMSSEWFSKSQAHNTQHLTDYMTHIDSVRLPTIKIV